MAVTFFSGQLRYRQQRRWKQRTLEHYSQAVIVVSLCCYIHNDVVAEVFHTCSALACLTAFWNTSAAGEIPNFNGLYLLRPRWVVNVGNICWCSSSWWYPAFRFSLENTVAPMSSWMTSSMVGVMWCFTWKYFSFLIPLNSSGWLSTS